LNIREDRRRTARGQRGFLVDNNDVVDSIASDTKWIERRVLTRIKAECVKCVLGNRHCQHYIPSRLEEVSRCEDTQPCFDDTRISSLTDGVVGCMDESCLRRENYIINGMQARKGQNIKENKNAATT
jgi:hypothetical protein